MPGVFTFGKQTVTGADMELTRDEADEAAAVLEHSVTYTLALQIVQAMKDVLGDARRHQSASVRCAFEIARLIRNSYAHQPFAPHWSIDPACAGETFEVPRIARLDTTELSGQAVCWQDYGGMLALFRLSQFVRSVILPSETVNIPPLIEGPLRVPECKPGDVIQQGRLLLTMLDRLPEGATPIPQNGPIELDAPDGVHRIEPRE